MIRKLFSQEIVFASNDNKRSLFKPYHIFINMFIDMYEGHFTCVWKDM